MSERKARYQTTPIFPEPNYTQTPNNFFDMLPDMSDAELRVTCVMIRQTFGYHRDGFKMGVSKLADAAGLSRQGALDGASAAEERGSFRRTNPSEQGEAEWELIVAPSTELIPPLQPVEATPQLSRGQVGVKESINKDSNNGAKSAAMPLDWKIAHNEEITQLDIPNQTFDVAAARDAADLIEMQCPGGGPLALAFMVARKIIFPESKIKGQRKAARELLRQGVRPEHVQQAVYDLVEKNMTIVDLFSVTKTAVSIAHPPESQGYNPQGLVVGV